MTERYIIDLHLFALNTNTTGTSTLSEEIKEFYSMRVLDHAEPKLVYSQFAVKEPIPLNHGKTLEVRVWGKVGKRTTALVEGTPPDGQALAVTTKSVEVYQFGGYWTLSDFLEMTAIDNMHNMATKKAGEQAGKTLDTLTREVVMGGDNVMYCPIIGTDGAETAVSHRYDLTNAAKFNLKTVVLAAGFLEGQDAPTPQGGEYVCVIHPHIKADLLLDDDWKEAQKYAVPEKIFKGELGSYGNVRFVVSTEAKVWRGANLTVAAANLTCKSTVGTGSESATVAVDEAITAGEATALVGRYVLIDGDQYEIQSANAGAAGSASIVIDTEITQTDGHVIYPGEAGAGNVSVYGCVVLGADAYMETELSGNGLEYIAKQLGSAGTADALNQISTVGWKATHGAMRLVEEYMIRIECSSPNYSTTAAN